MEHSPRIANWNGWVATDHLLGHYDRVSIGYRTTLYPIEPLMKCDAERVADRVRDFETLRLAGGKEQDRATERLADCFEEAGFEVKRQRRLVAPDSVSDTTPLEVWPAALFAMGAGLVLEARMVLGQGAASPFELAAIFSLVVVIALAGRRLGTGRWGVANHEVPSLLAREPGGESAPVRVVFLTHGETRPPVSSYRLRRWFSRLDWLWLGLLWIPCFMIGGREWLGRAGPALLVGLAFLASLRRVDSWANLKAPYPADNRTGMALMPELASVLTPRLQRRVELAFLVIGSRAETWDPEGWPRRLQSWPEKPTLVVCLEAPGVGERLQLDGRGQAMKLGAACARDLWLPCQPYQTVDPPLDHRAFAAVGFPAIELVGDLEAETINPRLLEATVQWAEELSLRWFREQGPADS